MVDFVRSITALLCFSIGITHAAEPKGCTDDSGSIQRNVQELVYTDLIDLRKDYCLANEIADEDASKADICGRYARLIKNVIRKEYYFSEPIECGESSTEIVDVPAA